MTCVFVQARVQQLPVDVVKVQVCSRPTESYEKAYDLNNDCHQVYELKCDENYEASMISRPNTAIQPRTMMVITLNALTADIAVIAPW